MDGMKLLMGIGEGMNLVEMGGYGCLWEER